MNGLGSERALRQNVNVSHSVKMKEEKKNKSINLCSVLTVIVWNMRCTACKLCNHDDPYIMCEQTTHPFDEWKQKWNENKEEKS